LNKKVSCYFVQFEIINILITDIQAISRPELLTLAGQCLLDMSGEKVWQDDSSCPEKLASPPQLTDKRQKLRLRCFACGNVIFYGFKTRKFYYFQLKLINFTVDASKLQVIEVSTTIPSVSSELKFMN